MILWRGFSFGGFLGILLLVVAIAVLVYYASQSGWLSKLFPQNRVEEKSLMEKTSAPESYESSEEYTNQKYSDNLQRMDGAEGSSTSLPRDINSKINAPQ